MCGLFGMISPRLSMDEATTLVRVARATEERGSDACGYAITNSRTGNRRVHRALDFDADRLLADLTMFLDEPIIIIGNMRAEPTTEWFDGDLHESMMHPFADGQRAWHVVHNGVIANDGDLVERGYMKHGSPIDSAVLPDLFRQMGFIDGVREIKGSYAIMAVPTESPTLLHIATNYKPLYVAIHDEHTPIWSSQLKFLERGGLTNVVPMPQYQAHVYTNTPDGPYSERYEPDLYPEQDAARRAVVVYSGGLDSTVTLAHAVAEHGAENVAVLHFRYGCRAEDQEWNAVYAVTHELGVPVGNIEMLNMRGLFKRIASTSPLLDEFAVIHTEGDEGAEFAYEWVPARNLIFLSLAIAYAENTGAGRIYVGTNLEESGAYPDNEPEFINRLNHLMPYAVADGKRVVIDDVVGNMMKHQIVAYGLELEAPMELAWSCYYGGEQHCGECGPCKMRKVAFRMNEADDRVHYAKD